MISKAAVTLPYKLAPLICLFSQIIFVGSVAATNLISFPKIYSLIKPYIAGSSFPNQPIFYEYSRASLYPSSDSKVIKAQTGCVSLFKVSPSLPSVSLSPLTNESISLLISAN
jgi:hypothetical protein